MLTKIVKIILSIPIILFLVLILIVNFRLHSLAYKDERLNELRGLKNLLDEHADIDMQKIYPEGYIFFNALYGLTWCSYAEQLDRPSDLFKEGHLEIQRAFNNINSSVGRNQFEEDLSLSYGAFYNGWSTYLLGKKLSLENPGDWNENEVYYFRQQCDKIAAALSANPYPVSYTAMAWPADATTCAAALSLHDKIFSPKYKSTISGWIDGVKSRFDKNGLIPHRVNPLTGKSIQQARGSSQSLILIFLQEIDEEFAIQQFIIYKEKFLDSKIGLLGIREYSSDEYGIGDIDSGPVILQIGAAATIVGSKTTISFGEKGIGATIRSEIEAFGFPVERNGQKKYLTGRLPMADIFIAWAHAGNTVNENEASGFLTFHLYSLLFSAISLVLLWFLWKHKRNRNVLHIPWE